MILKGPVTAQFEIPLGLDRGVLHMLYGADVDGGC